ncbi:Type 1 glutamine amidotransferase-like domain-containing protein [Paenibacillus gansuensis]|uniref:Type 1 glutamine amidotransferase-like domain-containing protein n=1 Tax=Paenibacillus gansuensis TaxID=306542 RepID=A0ABW5PF15_9BACL
MKYYLSSFKIGNEEVALKRLTENGNKKVAFINNALDFATDLERRKQSDAIDVSDLERLGFHIEILDLREYFYKSIELEKKLEGYDVIWTRGGNTFVLAQAMKLSGFDEIIKQYHRIGKQIVYGGYSAGICILGPTLKGLQLVDDPKQKPYGEQHSTIWDGLNILDYSIAPHYRSDHPESEDIEKVVDYLIENKILFKTLKDGEVIVIE